MMKNILFLVGSLLFLASCGSEIDLPPQNEADYSLLYIPQSVNGNVTVNVNVADTAKSTIYGAYLGGPFAAESNIDVDFRVNTAVLDSFNRTNTSEYAILPSSAFQLESATAAIPPGERSTKPLKLHFVGSQLSDLERSEYVIPLTVQSAQAKTNPKLETTFFIVRISK